MRRGWHRRLRSDDARAEVAAGQILHLHALCSPVIEARRVAARRQPAVTKRRPVGNRRSTLH